MASVWLEFDGAGGAEGRCDGLWRPPPGPRGVLAVPGAGRPALPGPLYAVAVGRVDDELVGGQVRPDVVEGVAEPGGGQHADDDGDEHAEADRSQRRARSGPGSGPGRAGPAVSRSGRAGPAAARSVRHERAPAG